MPEIPVWAVWIFGTFTMAILYHIGTKLDEIAKLLRELNSK